MAIRMNPSKNIPTRTSNSEQWISWHQIMKSYFGKKNANALWVKAWGMRGTSSANTNDLRTYMESQGVTIDKSAWDSVVDKTADVTDFMGDIYQIGKWTGIALVVIIVGGVGMIIFNIAKQPVAATKAAASLRTGGLVK